MSNILVHNTILETVQSYVPDARVLLFGSRARGDHNYNSDYDLLVITPETFTAKEKINLSSQLDKAIVSAIHAPVDLLINSEEEVLAKQKLPGHIIRSIIREGISL